MARILPVALLVFACGKNQVAAHARIVHGPGFSGSVVARASASAAAPASGHWFISPDQGKVTLTALTFHDASGGEARVALSGCSPVYNRNDASLSTVLDCPFEVRSGTYVEVDVDVAAAAQVLINDAVNGLYTDPSSPTGLSTTPPSGGAQFVSFTAATPSGSNVNTITTALAAPFVVGTGLPDGGSAVIELNIVEDMIHTVFVNVNGTSAQFDTSLQLPPVSLLPSVAGPGRVEYYAPSGTAKNVSLPLATTGNETGSVRVFYAPPPQPSFLWQVVLGPSESFAANPAKFGGDKFKPGGYLGIDASGTACWALPTDFTWTSYSQLCEMKVPANVGDTTTLRCQHMMSVPAPASGDTYASGCPAITPDATETLTLVAR